MLQSTYLESIGNRVGTNVDVWLSPRRRNRFSRWIRRVMLVGEGWRKRV